MLALFVSPKHENDETDDDDDNGETMWVQFRPLKIRRVIFDPVSSVDRGNNEASEGRPPTSSPISSVDGGNNEASEGRPPTSPPISSVDDGGGTGSGREVRPPTSPPVSSVDGGGAVRAATCARRRRVAVTCLTVAATFIATRFVVRG